ncbi:MAG: hypothetical protein JXD22_11815 [Sedimentisphaerales bacterium]|nr:hypothetical protein [Sedimentisphaerales bacterium]
MASLAAAAGGSLVILSCLAGKRAELVKAYNIQQEMKARQEQSAQHDNNQAQQKKSNTDNAK